MRPNRRTDSAAHSYSASRARGVAGHGAPHEPKSGVQASRSPDIRSSRQRGCVSFFMFDDANCADEIDSLLFTQLQIALARRESGRLPRFVARQTGRTNPSALLASSSLSRTECTARIGTRVRSQRSVTQGAWMVARAWVWTVCSAKFSVEVP